jgi:hypothetical protein
MNDGHAAVTATMMQAPACWAPHGWLRGAAGRGAPPGTVRRLREQRERLRASGPVNSRLRVRPHRSPIPALPRRRLLFRPWAAHWSPYRRSPQRWRHSAVAFRPISDAGNRRVPADTLRRGAQSAYSHTPRTACQHRWPRMVQMPRFVPLIRREVESGRPEGAIVGEQIVGGRCTRRCWRGPAGRRRVRSRAQAGEPSVREWNRLDGWRRQVDGLRRAAYVRIETPPAGWTPDLFTA